MAGCLRSAPKFSVFVISRVMRVHFSLDFGSNFVGIISPVDTINAIRESGQVCHTLDEIWGVAEFRGGAGDMVTNSML